MRFNNISIKWKLFAYLFLFVAAMLVVLWLFQTVFLESFYKSIKTGQIKGTAELIESNIDDENVFGLIERLQLEDNINIEILDERGTPIRLAGSESQAPALVIQPGLLERMIEAAKRNGGSYLELSRLQPFSMPPLPNGRIPPPSLRGYESILLLDTAATQAGETRYVFIDARISPVNSTVETLRVQLLYITAALVMMALLLALLVSHKISKPIMRTNEKAKLLAGGDYAVRFTNGGYREIGELNDTLNTASRELSRVEGLRRELIANVSHDLRTPLTMITGFAEMIRDLPGENTPENAQVIIDESNRLTRLVKDLLDLSKLQSGVEVTKSRFCITKSVRDMIARVNIFGADRIAFEAFEDIWVEANENQLLQVIYNLLTNALTYSNGHVRVRQQKSTPMVRIEVEDCGEGIAQDDLPYVWERYYRVDKTHRRADIGTGLGLSIVKGVIDAHRGRCGVISAVGQGSVFWFELPHCLVLP